MNLYCVLSFFIFSSASLLKVTLCVTSMGYFCCCYPQKMRESHTNHKEWAQKGHRHIFSIYHALWALTFFKFSVIFLLSLWLSLWLLFFIVWKESRKVSQKMIHHPHITCNLHEQKKMLVFFVFEYHIFFVNCCGKGNVYTRWRRRYKEREWII